MKKAIVVAALGLVAAGCTSETHTSSSTSSTTKMPHAQAVREWVETTMDYQQDLANAVVSAGLAAGRLDYAALHAACHRAHDAADELQRHMPTPDKELTDTLQASLNDFDTASHFCVAAVEDNDANEARHTGEFMRSADEHLKIAAGIRDRLVKGTS